MTREEQLRVLWTDKGTHLAATDEPRAYLRRMLLVVQGGKAAG